MLEKKWEQNPDQRFCQLLVNMGVIPYCPSNDNFNLEDNDLEKHFERLLEENSWERR